MTLRRVRISKRSDIPPFGAVIEHLSSPMHRICPTGRSCQSGFSSYASMSVISCVLRDVSSVHTVHCPQDMVVRLIPPIPNLTMVMSQVEFTPHLLRPPPRPSPVSSLLLLDPRTPQPSDLRSGLLTHLTHLAPDPACHRLLEHARKDTIQVQVAKNFCYTKLPAGAFTSHTHTHPPTLKLKILYSLTSCSFSHD